MTLQERLREDSNNVPYDEFNLMHKAADRIDADEALMRRIFDAMNAGYMGRNHTEFAACLGELELRLGMK